MTTGAPPVRGDLDRIRAHRDLFDRGAGEIGDARVLLTLSEGIAVHADPALGW